MKTYTKTIVENVIQKANKDAKKYFKITAIIYFLYLSVILFIIIYNFSNILTAKEILSIIFLLGMPVVVIIIFYILCKYKWKNYFLLKKLILFQKSKNPYRTLHYLIFVLLRIFASLTFYTIICISPMIIDIIFNCFSYYINLSKFFGAYIILVIFSLAFSYLFILLAKLIALKSYDNPNKYFYWLYFIKANLLKSPVTTYLGIPLLILLSITTILLPVFIPNFFSIKEISKINNLSLLLTVGGIGISIIIIIVSEMLSKYMQLYLCYEEYTSHILHDKMIGEQNIRLIIIGFGNLGRLICGHILEKLISRIEKNIKDSIKHFELIIDKNYKIRLIYRELAVIEKKSILFEEFMKYENDLSFGFFNAHELISGKLDEKSLAEEIAIFGIKGDGNYLPVLKLANIDNADIVINTASEADLGFNLRSMKEALLIKNERPVIITTVEDSSTFSFMEQNNITPIFPIHASNSEGWSIGSRLFMLNCKIIAANKNDKLSNIFKKLKIFIIGNGKTIYYILQCYITHLNQTGLQNKEIREFIEGNITIITDDKSFINESVDDSKNNEDKMHGHRIWNYYNIGTEFIKIHLLEGKYTSVGLIMNACKNSLKQDDTVIFTISSCKIHDAIRATEHCKYAINHIPILNSYFVSSISVEIYSHYKNIIESTDIVKNNMAELKSFPNSIDDIILKKNLSVGSQILSIAELLQDGSQLIGRRFTHEPGSREEMRKSNLSGEISICLKNEGLSFCKLIAGLSGIKNIELTNNNRHVPSFYYSYSYPLRWMEPEILDTFIFRGDVFLCDSYKNSFEPNIMGVALNGSPSFKNEKFAFIEDYLKNNYGSVACDYNHSCPVSTNKSYNKSSEKNKVDDIPLEGKSNFATIKIWANKENIPGALFLCVCDFLMAGEKLELCDNYKSEKSLIICYENCRLCHKQYALNRFYVSLQEMDDEIIENKKKLLHERNIIAISIKTAKQHDELWEDYSKDICDYLNNICSSEYIYKKHNCGFLVVEKSKYNKQKYREYIDRDL